MRGRQPESSNLEIEKTTLIQSSISNLDDAPAKFNRQDRRGTPIVLTLTNKGSNCCCCTCKLDVPDGITVIEHVWGRHKGLLKPGSKCCYYYTHEIAYILTKGAIRYDAPVKACPTKDNIYVEIDLMIILRLGDNEEDSRNFIYKLGAKRLDQLLKNESQESIRNFIRKYKYYEVPDLKSEISGTVNEGLNKKFNQFGVFFEHVAITAVKLPGEIENTLSETTLFDIKLQKQIKQYENSRLIIDNREEIDLANLRLTNKIREEEMLVHQKRSLITRDTQIVKGESEYEQEMIKAQMKQEELMIRVKGEKSIAENDAKTKVVANVARVKAECDSRQIMTDEQSKAYLVEAEGLLKSTKFRSDAINAESNAEQAISTSIQSKRDFEYRMAKLEVVDGLAGSGNLVIGGSSGDTILNSIVSTIK